MLFYLEPRLSVATERPCPSQAPSLLLEAASLGAHNHSKGQPGRSLDDLGDLRGGGQGVIQPLCVAGIVVRQNTVCRSCPVKTHSNLRSNHEKLEPAIPDLNHGPLLWTPGSAY